MKTRRLKPPNLYSDPAWEAMKASSRNLRHADAVAECADLSALYFRMWKREASGMVDLDTILRTLHAKKIPFVLTGAHGISGWTGRPRATHDVDILVKPGRNLVRAVNALRALYPTLEVRTFYGVTGFFLPGDTQSLIDVTFPHRADQEETLLTAIWVEERGQRYRVPTLEAALANKYGAMLALNRDPIKRTFDAADFAGMVRHSTTPGRAPIDLEKIALLGEKVWLGGSGAELLRLVEEARAGRVPHVDPR